MGPRMVVVKRGEHGSLWYDRETQTAGAVSAVSADAVDPTGCGDAYCGGFLAGLVRTGRPELAVQWGAVSASYVLEGYGPSRILQARPAEAAERLSWFRSNQCGEETE